MYSRTIFASITEVILIKHLWKLGNLKAKQSRIFLIDLRLSVVWVSFIKLGRLMKRVEMGSHYICSKGSLFGCFLNIYYEIVNIWSTKPATSHSSEYYYPTMTTWYESPWADSQKEQSIYGRVFCWDDCDNLTYTILYNIKKIRQNKKKSQKKKAHIK